MTDAPHDDGGGPSEGNRPPQEMRLRSSRPPVTRLSRKVLLGLGAAAAIGIGGALFFALKPQHQTTGSELYNTNNRNTPDGLANLPRDYTGLPKPAPQLGPPLPGDLGRPILNAGAPAPGMPTPAAGRSRGTAHCPGARSGAGQPSLRNDQCRSDRVAFADTDVGAVCSRGGKRSDRPTSRPRITSSLFSTATSIDAQPVPIASSRRPANTCCRPAR